MAVPECKSSDIDDSDVIEEFSDSEEERKLLRSSLGVDDVICEEDLADWGTFCSHTLSHFLDPQNFSDGFYDEDGDEWQMNEECDPEERELKTWFCDVQENSHKKRDDYENLDMLTKLYQELADEEFARSLVCISFKPHLSNNPAR